eukprot:CFRG6782T1
MRTFMAKAEMSNHLSREVLQMWPACLMKIECCGEFVLHGGRKQSNGEDKENKNERLHANDKTLEVHAHEGLCQNVGQNAEHFAGELSHMVSWALCAFGVFFEYDSKYLRQQSLRQLLCFDVCTHLPHIAQSQAFIDFVFETVFPIMARSTYYSVDMVDGAGMVLTNMNTNTSTTTNAKKNMNGRGDAECVDSGGVVSTVTLLPRFFTSIACLLPSTRRILFIKRFVHALTTVSDGVALGVLSTCLPLFPPTLNAYGLSEINALCEGMAVSIGKCTSQAWRYEIMRNVLMSVWRLGSVCREARASCCFGDHCETGVAVGLDATESTDTYENDAPCASDLLKLIVTFTQLQGRGEDAKGFVQSILNNMTGEMSEMRVCAISRKAKCTNGTTISFLDAVVDLCRSFCAEDDGEWLTVSFGSGNCDRKCKDTLLTESSKIELYHNTALGLASVLTALVQPHTRTGAQTNLTSANIPEYSTDLRVEKASDAIIQLLSTCVDALSLHEGQCAHTTTHSHAHTRLFTPVIFRMCVLFNHTLEMWAVHPSPFSQMACHRVFGLDTGTNHAQTLCGEHGVYENPPVNTYRSMKNSDTLNTPVRFVMSIQEWLDEGEYWDVDAVGPGVIILSSLYTHVLSFIPNDSPNDTHSTCLKTYMPRVLARIVDSSTPNTSYKPTSTSNIQPPAYTKTKCVVSTARTGEEQAHISAPFFSSVLTLGTVANKHGEFVYSMNKNINIIPPTSTHRNTPAETTGTSAFMNTSKTSNTHKHAYLCIPFDLSVVQWRFMIKRLLGIIVVRANEHSLGHWGMYYARANDALLKIGFLKLFSECTDISDLQENCTLLCNAVMKQTHMGLVYLSDYYAMLTDVMTALLSAPVLKSHTNEATLHVLSMMKINSEAMWKQIRKHRQGGTLYRTCVRQFCRMYLQPLVLCEKAFYSDDVIKTVINNVWKAGDEREGMVNYISECLLRYLEDPTVPQAKIYETRTQFLSVITDMCVYGAPGKVTEQRGEPGLHIRLPGRHNSGSAIMAQTPLCRCAHIRTHSSTTPIQHVLYKLLFQVMTVLICCEKLPPQERVLPEWIAVVVLCMQPSLCTLVLDMVADAHMTRSVMKSIIAILGRSCLALDVVRKQSVNVRCMSVDADDTECDSVKGSVPPELDSQVLSYCRSAVSTILSLVVVGGRKGVQEIAQYYLYRLFENGMAEECGIDAPICLRMKQFLSLDPTTRRKIEYSVIQSHRLTSVDVLSDISFYFLFNQYYQMMDIMLEEQMPEDALVAYGCAKYCHVLSSASLNVTARQPQPHEHLTSITSVSAHQTNVEPSSDDNVSADVFASKPKMHIQPLTVQDSLKNADVNVNIERSVVSEMSNRQTKITPWETSMFVPHFDLPDLDTDADIDVDVSNHGQDTVYKNSSTSSKRKSMILCATLVCKAPNLGGLARTCEIFQMTELVVSSKTLLTKSEFKNLAVAADQLLTMTEVTVENLHNYLLYMKEEEGYTLIGLEQTNESVDLQSYTFPQKVIVLLGSEGFGIPPAYLHLLDVCLEIPQFGQTRSLNVHVSGALVMWEQAKQAFLSGSGAHQKN